MSDTAGKMNATQVKRALLERLRFERAMGLECVHPLPLKRVAAAQVAVTPARTMSAAPAVPASSAASTGVPHTVGGIKEAFPLPTPATPEAKAVRWKQLETLANGCVKCVLHKGRTNVVFGTGNRNADLLFIGEGPGFDEDQVGQPFVGKAGQLLNKIITAMGMKREDVYICNVVKCRPPENRTPLPDEMAACSPYLFEQIELVSPKAIVTLGNPATQTILRTSTGIMSMRGRWGKYKDIPVMPTFHPAFVLRQYTEEVRRQVWSDMKAVVERLKA